MSTFVPGWTWQTMHWLVGIRSSNLCWIGCPGWSLRIVGSTYLTHSSRLGRRRSPVAVLGQETAGDRTAIVRIQHVTGAATTAAIVAGVIVGAEEVQRRVEQTCLGQADEDRVGSILGTEATIAKSFARTTGFFQNRSGIPTSARKRPPRSKIRSTLPG